MHRIILSIVACVALGFSARAQADLNERLPQDPEMVIGKLPNGITYYIRHNETPKGQAFFSIIRDAGSLLEEPGQEGLAHFLEHMAFQGTENFPGRGVVETLERHGVRYGYDINAVTNESETVYHFGGVPTDDGKFLDTCVMILHDWSYYLTLDKADIDNERKVIEEEWNMKNTPDNRIQDQISEVVFKGSKYAGRDAIGSLEVIRNFDPGELRAFYHKWYRTDLEAVAIIGDFDVKQMERRVKKILSKVPAVENPEPRPFFEIPDHEEPYYCMATDPGAGTGSSISLLTLHRDMSSEAKGTVAYLKEEAMIQLFNRLMSARMAKALQKPDCPLAQAGIAYVYFKRGYYSYQVGGVPKNDEESALRTLLTENERLVRHGFTDEEVEDAKGVLLRTLDNSYRARNVIRNETYAELAKEHFLKGNPIVDIDFQYEKSKELIAGITAEEMLAKVREWNTTKNRTAVIMGSDMVWHLMEDDVAAIADEVKAADVEPYRYERVEITPLLTETPEGGKVTGERELPQFDAVEWTLDNGAKVVFRESALEPNTVSLRAYSPGGLSLYDDEDLPSVEMAGQIVPLFNIGVYNPKEWQQKLKEHQTTCKTRINSLSEEVLASAVPEEVETMLQAVYMRFMAQKFDKQLFEQVKSQNVAYLMMNRGGNPQQAMQDSVKVFQANYHPRVRTMSADYFGDVDFDTMERAYRERFSNAADFTFFITGNITAGELKPLVEKYIGAIPSTDVREKWVDRGVRGPQGTFTRDVALNLGQPAAIVIISLSKEMAFTFRDALCNEALKYIVQSRCMERIREREGGTYAVNVNEASTFEPYPCHTLTVEFNCAPENVERLKTVVREELRRVADEPVTEVELTKAVAGMRNTLAASKGKNDYWTRAMLRYYKTGDDPNAPENSDDILDSLTPADVQDFARRLQEDGNVIDVVFRSK